MTVQNIMTYVPTKYQVLIYGQSGTGKTTFGASWAKAVQGPALSGKGGILFLDSDEGIISIITAPPNVITDDMKKHIFHAPIIEYPPEAKTPQGYLTVQKAIDSIADTGEYEGCRPHTIVLDSITTLSEMILNHVVRMNGRVEPVLKDWGQQMDKITKLINRARGIQDVNFIAVAHEQYTKDEMSGRIWCLPMVTGKLAPKIGLYFDEVYHTTVFQKGDKHEYVMHTKATGLITAKSRFNLPSPCPTTFLSLKGKIEDLQKRAKALQDAEDKQLWPDKPN